MWSRNLLVLWIWGLRILCPVLSSQNSAIRYSYETNQNDAKNLNIQTDFVPLYSESERFKRDTSSVLSSGSEETTTTANKIYINENKNKSEAKGGLTDDFLKNQVFQQNKTEKDDVKTTHKDYSFDNDTLHKYYMHTIEQGKDYFYDLDQHNFTGPNRGKVKEHDMLSQSYRRAATINLSFKFPFYGHLVPNITIATGGFLYTGDYVHSWLAATQYIAPLMANFDTSSTHNAKIRYLDDGDKLIVEWKDVYLQDMDKMTGGRDGPFTFQVILFQNGNITFAYETIPVDIKIITDDDHPVKVGLSDAYIIDRTVYFARRKTIYEYHRLSMKDERITNKTAILFQSLPTCNTNPDCGSCLANSNFDWEYVDPSLDFERLEDGKKLECRWCPGLGRCSDGTDRNRQSWLKSRCDTYNVSNIQQCSATGQPFPGKSNNYKEDDPSHSKISHIPDYHDSHDSQTVETVHTGSVVVSVFITMLVISFLGWIGYAYFNPNTSSGRFLIKYRPGAWRWRQSGGRYTAASIHM